MRTRILLAAFVLLCVVAAIEGGKSKKKSGKGRGGSGGKSERGSGDGGKKGSGCVSIPLLRGVNRSGTEYACIKPESKEIFEGPIDDDAIEVIKSWNVNAVRVPLNEQCWLGEDVPNPTLGGDNYKKAIKSWVEALRAHKLYVILDLHWTQGKYTGENKACDVNTASCQKPMPSKKAKKFWKQVAKMFKDDDGVIFDVFNEPFPDMPIKNKDDAWKCWRDGGDACPKSLGFEYEVAGMNDLVKAIRKTGAKNLIILGGLTWANDLDKWLDYLPDNTENIGASMHSYNFNACVSEDCWQKTIGKIKDKGYRVVIGEIGEHGCTHDYIDRLMKWLDSKNIDYLAWTFNAWDCSGGPALITNYNGEPTNFGTGYKEHLKSQDVQLSP